MSGSGRCRNLLWSSRNLLYRAKKAKAYLTPIKSSRCLSKSPCHNSLLDNVFQAVGDSWFKCWVWALLGVGARRVKLQTRFFILGRVRQHAEPDRMPLVNPFQRNMGAIVIVGSQTMRIPMKVRHAFERGKELMQIQGKTSEHDGAVVFATDELDGGGIDNQFTHALVLLKVRPLHGSHRTVGLDAARHDFC